MKTEPFRFAPGAVRRRFALHPLSFAVCMAISGTALALPQGGTVIAGSATIERPTPKSEVIDQKSDKAIIDWRSFSIAGDEKVRFSQPSVTSIALNRVTGYDPSFILGQMSSNGRIFLVNPYGVVFGAGARVDVGGLVVSTLSIANSDFLASRYNLTSVDPAAPAQRGAIRNEGTISAPGGLVVLAGPTVTNTGTIVANGGRVGLAAANSVSVDVEGDGLIFFQANATDAKNRLEQLGRIQADGGTIEMRAAARGAFADTVLNMAGVVQARSIGTREGKVVIDGGGDGITTVSGKIDATGLAAGERGGEATIQGQRVLIDNGAVVDVSGSSGGGLIRVGGDFRGANPVVRNAEYTGVAPTAQLRADAVDNGDGGKVAVWSDKITRYDGSISAQGGKQGGDGGFVEVSGKEQLAFRGNVSTLAPKGKPGTLLLDPADILITDNAASPDDAQLDADTPTVGDAAGLIKSTDVGATFTLSSAKLEAIGNANAIDLQATNSIVINDLVTNVTTTKTLTLNGGDASFRAGAGGISMASDNTIKVTNGSLTMDSTAFGAGAVVAGTLTAKNGMTLAGTTVTLNGPLTVTAAGHGVSVTGATALAAGSGTVTLTGNNAGNGVAFGTIDGAQALAITATGGDIVLGAVGGTTPLTGVTLAANTASLGAVTTSGAQDYSGVTTTTLNGTLTVNTAGAGVTAGTTLLAAGGGTIALAGSNAANDVTLGTVDGPKTLAVTAGGGDIVLGAVGGTTPLTGVTLAGNTASLQAVTTSGAQDYSGVATTTLHGTLTVNSAGAGVSTGATTLALGSGTITLTGNNAANDVALGTVDGAHALNITATGGDIVLGAVGGTTPLTGVTLASNTASLGAVTTTGAQDYSGVTTTTLNGTLTVNTVGAGVVAGTTLLGAGGGTVTLTGNNAANDVTLGTVDGAHALNITATGGDVVLGTVGGTTPLTGLTINSNTASIQDVSTAGNQLYNARVSAGAVSLNAGAGTITATNASNDFTAAVNLTGGTTQITDANALALGTLATGALTVTSSGALNLGSGSASSIGAVSNGGPVSQGGVLIVSGTTNVNAGANSITLVNSGNDFTGAVGLTTAGANNATLKDTNALVLGASAVGGNLDVTAKGSISQTGPLLVTGTSTFTVDTALLADVLLATNANNFTGAVTIATSGGASLNDVGLRNDSLTPALPVLSLAGLHNLDLQFTNAAITVPSANLSGTLNVVAGGDITQAAGGLQVAGTSSFSAGANAITLLDPLNNFAGAVSVANSLAKNVSLRDVNAIVLGASNVGTATFAVTAGGDISETGPLLVGGTSSFTVNAAGSNVVLSTANNNFANTVTVATAGAGTVNDLGLRNVNASAAVPILPGNLHNLDLQFTTAAISVPSVSLSGTLNVVAGGPITQAPGGVHVAGTSSFNAGANAITIADASNDFTGAVGLTNSGANNVSLRDANALVLGASNVGSGTLAVTASGPITQTGPIVQAPLANAATFNAGANAITIADAGNDFTGAVGLANSGANNVSLRDANALVLGASNVGSGTLAVTAGGPITQTGPIVQAAAAAAATFNAGANAITIADPLNDFTGAVSVTNSGANNVSLRDANALVLGASNVGSGTLAVTAGGPITQTGPIVQAPLANAVTFNAGANAITIADAGNDFTGAVGLTNSGANNVSLRDANALVLGASNVGSGTLAVTAGGPITQTGPIVQAPLANAATFNAGANAITIADAGNDFTGAVSVTNSGAKNVSLRDANALILGASNVGSGTLSVAAGGPITQTGPIVQAPLANAATFNAGANAITLANPGNDFTGAVGLTTAGANNATLKDTNALVLGASSVGGNLDVTAKGSISQTGPLLVTGTSTFTVDTALLADVLLATNANNFTGAVTIATSGGASLNDVGLRNDSLTPALPVLSLAGLHNLDLQFTNAAISVPSANLSGTLNVVAGGDITQAAGGVQVAGTSSFSAGANAITLLDPLNNFAGAVSVANSLANNVSLRDVNAIVLGASNVGTATFAVTAGGPITQTGPVVQAAGAVAATFNAGANAITLANAGNDFTGAVNLTGTAVQVNDANALTLGVLATGATTVTSNGALNLGSGSASSIAANSSGGAVSQTGGLVVPGATNVNAGANTITLNNAGNDFGSFGATGGAVIVRDANALALDAINATSLTLNTGGAITQNAAAIVTNATTANAGASAITLGNAGNNFGSVGATGGAVTITDVNALALDAINATGLTVNTSAGNGAVTQNAVAIVAGATTVNAGSGGITLANAGNNFGNVAATGAAVSITDVNALALGAINATSLTVNTSAGNGAVTQTAAAIVSVASNVNAGTGPVTLNNPGNDFATLGVTGGATSIVDSNALTLTSLVSAPNQAVTVSAGGALTLPATAIDTGGAALSLTSGGALSTVGTLRGTNVSFASGGAMSIGNDVTSLGTLSLTSANAPISQSSGTITAAGATTVNAGSGDIALAQPTNDFQGNVALTGGGVSVRDVNNLAVSSLVSGANRPVSLIAGGTLVLPATPIDTGTADLNLQAVGGSLVINSALNGNNVTLTGATGLTLGANVTSSGDQIYTTAVQLAGNVILNAGASRIDLQGGANGGGNNLVLTSSNATANAIHTGAAITNTAQLTVTGNSTLGGDVTTMGNQTYAGALTLGSDVTLAAGAAKIDLQGAVDAAGHNLGLTSTNAAADAIHAEVTVSNAAQLTVTGKSTFASGVATTGAQLYSDTVTLGSNSNFSGSSLAFANGIVAGTFDLGLRSDTLNLAGAVTGSSNATLSSATQNATVGVAGGAGTYQVAQATLDRFASFASLTVGRADGSGDLTFGNIVLPTNFAVQSASGNANFTGTVSSAAGQARDLSVSTGGTTTFAGAVGGAIGGLAALGNLTVTGATNLNASTTTTAAQSLGGPVVEGADATLSASSLSFANSLDVGGHALTMFTDALAIGGAATGSGAGSVQLAPKAPAGSIGVAGAAGTLQVSQGLLGSLAGVPTLTLGRADSTGAVTVGNLLLPAALAISNGSGDVAFTGTVDSAVGPARDLSVATGGTTAFNGSIGAIRPIGALVVGGASQLGSNVTTSGAQTFTGPTTLVADSILAGPSVSFGGTVDGAHSLTVNAAATQFGAAVGAGTGLTSLTTDAAGTTQLGGNVTTSGTQTYNDALLLNANSTIAGSSLTLAGSVDGGHTLAVNGATQVTLGGPIGATTPLAAISTGGPLLLGAGQVTTTGAQIFAGATTLGAATTLSGSSLSFGGAVDGAFDLMLQSAGTTSFAGSVGATTNLASLTTLGGGSVTLVGNQISTTGAQSFSGALQLAGSTTLTASSLTLTGPVSGATDLTLSTNALSGVTSLGGTGILTIAPNDSTLSIGVAGGAGALQVAQAVFDGASAFTAHVIGRSDGSGTISAGNLVLRVDTTLQTASGDIALGGSVDGAFALNLNSGGTTSIAGPIGATTPLKSLTTDNNPNATDGTTAGSERTLLVGDVSGSARIVTTGAQTYNDPLVAAVPVSFSGRAIVANQPLNQLAADASATPAPNVLANADTLQLHSTNDIRLGNTTLGNGGDIESETALHLAGTIQLDGGTLLLVAKGNSGTVPLSSELTGKSVNSQTTLESAATIVQDSGTISSAAGSLLSLKATGGGSIDVQQAGNNLLGKISAVSGTSGDNDVTRFESPPVVLSFIRLASTQINVAGAPPNSAPDAGIEADVVRLQADTLTTGPDGLIRARLPFNNLVGSNASIPGITFELTPTTLAGQGNFGTPDGFVQIRVGAADGGFITARPNGVSGNNAVIFLGGPADVRPFYDGNGKLTEIRVFYNGDAPRTPQEAGALAAVIALIEDARHQRFEEAVRTENVTSRLRSGVIAEVGAGRPATVGRESIKLPEICDVKAGTLRCK